MSIETESIHNTTLMKHHPPIPIHTDSQPQVRSEAIEFQNPRNPVLTPLLEP